jgi:AcrR family transcriptional regulator
MSTSKAPGPKRTAKRPETYHHGDLERVLVATATAMLEREGADNLSLREVARRADVSHNAPYRHFADRDALLASVAAEGFRALARSMTDARRAARPLRGVGKAYVLFALERPRLFGLMFGPGLKRGAYPDLAAAMDEVFAYLAQPFTDTIESADARAAMIAAWSIVHGLAHLLIDGRLGPRLLAGTQDVGGLIDDVLDVAGRGLGPTRE